MKICIDCGKELRSGIDRCDCIENAENKVLPNPVLEIVQKSVGTKLFLSAMIVYNH